MQKQIDTHTHTHRMARDWIGTFMELSFVDLMVIFILRFCDLRGLVWFGIYGLFSYYWGGGI